MRTPAQKRAGKSVPIKVIVTAPGNVVPRGTVKVEVFRYGKKKYTSNLPYAGGQITFVTQTLKRGVHVVNVTFTPDPGSVWNASSASTTFKIRRRRRRSAAEPDERNGSVESKPLPSRCGGGFDAGWTRRGDAKWSRHAAR